MQDSIFTKIIKGELPSHKIYEDDKTFAFLNIRPDRPGHVLVIPKAQIARVYDLPEEDYIALWRTAKKIAKHMEGVMGVHTLMHVVGYDVPHAHIHLVPANPDHQPGDEPPVASDDELAAMAKKLKLQA
jgi:histidine triad (HIT) family protein